MHIYGFDAAILGDRAYRRQYNVTSNLFWRLTCLFDYILEAAACSNVMICDGALESILRVMAPYKSSSYYCYYYYWHISTQHWLNSAVLLCKICH